MNNDNPLTATITKAAPFFVLVLCLVFLGVGQFMASSDRSFLANSGEVELTVIKVEDRIQRVSGTSSTGSRSMKTVYNSTFQYTKPNGETVEYAGDFWTSPQPHVLGEITQGRYDRRTGVLISNKLLSSRGLFATIFTVVGAIGLILSVILILRMRERRRQVI